MKEDNRVTRASLRTLIKNNIIVKTVTELDNNRL
jgi:hypothetical protein